MKNFLHRLWQANKPMTAVGLAMLPLFFLSLAGMAVDPRIITGAPAWLKPAKFAISISIYLLTLAGVYSYLTVWPRLMRAMAWVTAVAMVIEIVIIDGQALRGTTSHFNVATPLDQTLFAIMGLAIACLWLASAVIAIALFFERTERFGNRVLATALRYGMLLTVLGSGSGGAMVSPRASQIAAARAGQPMIHSGSHTVGAPDGGAGLPVTGWSTQHGDLRVPHFLGLHGLQAFPLLALFLLRRGVPQARAVRLVKLGAISYFALYLLLLAQAFRGEPLAAPSTATLAAFATWLSLSAAGAFLL